MPSDDELRQSEAALDACGRSVDVVVTHCAPTLVQGRIDPTFETDRLTDYLEHVRETVSFKRWFFGHYHLDRDYDDGFSALYRARRAICKIASGRRRRAMERRACRSSEFAIGRGAAMELRAEVRALYEDVEAFQPYNEQEAADKEVILSALAADSYVAERSAQAHLACSVWTVDPSFEQTLLVYHNIYDSWSWIGGHADGEFDLAAVALRELEEETGVHGRLVSFDGAGRPQPCGERAAVARISYSRSKCSRSTDMKNEGCT